MSTSFNKFNNLSSVTGKQFDDFKAFVKETQPIIKAINIGSIELLSSDKVAISMMNNGVIETAEFALSKTAFRNLMKALGLTYGAFDTFINTIGENATAVIVDAVKDALRSVEKKNVINIAISRKTGTVVDITKFGGEIMSNDTYFKIIETAMNGFENSGMKIKAMNLSDEGNISITILNDNWQFDLQGINNNLSDEYFSTGMTIIKTMNRIVINPFNERLICTNGMVDVSKNHAIVLNSSDEKNVRAFFDQAKDWGRGRTLFETEFKNKVIKMLGTNASFAEVKRAYDTVNSYMDNSYERAKMQLNADFPIVDIALEYSQKYHIELLKENKKFQSKVITPMNMWDLVNKLTWAASNPHQHEYNFTDTSSSVFGLQRTAGEFTFKEHYDLGMSVPQLYGMTAANDNKDIIEALRKSI